MPDRDKGGGKKNVSDPYLKVEIVDGEGRSPDSTTLLLLPSFSLALNPARLPRGKPLFAPCSRHLLGAGHQPCFTRLIFPTPQNKKMALFTHM